MKVSMWLATTLALTSALYSNAQDQQLDLESIYQTGQFYENRVYGLRSMNDGEHFSQIVRDARGGTNILRFSYATGTPTDTLFSYKWVDVELNIGDYSFSPNEDKILLATDVEPIYRRSTKENNYVYDIATRSLTYISEKGKQSHATFSPEANKVAFVRENNIYILDLEKDMEMAVTTDGKYNEIINGATDWVYEEEFAFAKAFFWSPDGRRIAYYRFDESEVKEMEFPMYGGLYPQGYSFKYPKAGEANSKVQISVYDLMGMVSSRVLDNSDPNIEYFPRIKWTAVDHVLAIQQMNRHQSQLDIVLYDCLKGEKKTAYTEKSSTYIDVSDSWTFTEKNKSMIILSDKNGYNHLYEVNVKKGSDRSITQGAWDVTNFYGYDAESGYSYFASAEESPTRRSIYRILINGKGKEKLSNQVGWNSAQFSMGLKYYINTFSDANTPSSFTLHKADGSLVRILEENNDLKGRLANYEMSNKEFFSFTTDYGVDLNCWMIKPSNFDPSKKYPVLVTIYGGPGSQEVVDRWDGSSYMWHQYLAERGYIVVSIDNRGTGARGAEFKKSTYKQLGKLEVEDYISFADYLSSQDYIDGSRIGIWGWSYGGYMSSLAISKGADSYALAIAVAPVTTWRYYDSIYTERYMQTPQENPEGYDDNSPINFTGEIKGKYLLIHGNADDNVHFQNSADMVTSLVNKNIPFDFMMYPNKNHGIYGGNTRIHLFNKMTDYIIQNL